MNLDRHRLYFYLIPVLGFFPAWWTLYRSRYHPTAKTSPKQLEQQQLSRLSVTLTFLWLSGHLLTALSAEQFTQWTLPILIMSSLWSTAYVSLNFGLMLRLWQGRSLWLPGVSHLSRKLP